MIIVVALDGTLHSQRALEMAVARQWHCGSEMRLVHAPAHRSDGIFSGIVSVLGNTASGDRTGTSAQAVLDELAVGIASRVQDLKVSGDVLHGEPVGAVLEFSKTIGAHLIISGTRETHGLEALLLGSVSQGLLERADCPVLVARSAAADPVEAPKRILVCIDDSQQSAGAIEWLISQHWLRGTQVVLLSVVDSPPESAGEDIRAAGTHLLEWQAGKLFMEDYVEKWALLLQHECSLEAIYSGVIEGVPADLILKAAKNWPADLIVLGSHGRSGIAKLVLGSVSQKVAACAPCSVEVVKGVESRFYEPIRSSISESALMGVLHRPDTKTRRQNPSGFHALPPTMG